MAGRHTGWMHTRGGRDQAQPGHVQAARALLGRLQNRLRLGGILSGYDRAVLQDGTLIEAVVNMRIPSIRITPPPLPKEDTPPETGGFVVTARHYTLQDGIDAEYPQQILLYDDADEWSTGFHSSDVSAYATFGRKKFKYAGQFPDGIKDAGNIDWCSENEVRVSWYGPALRYWADAYRQPNNQYGKWVFLLGQVLLDIDAYCTEAAIDFDERLVLGAALVDTRLYVMQAEIADVASVTEPAGTYEWVSAPYTTDAVKLRLVRYTATGNDVIGYSLVVGSHETLWQRTAAGYVNPWVFNSDATACESFAMPAELRFVLGTGNNPTRIRPSASSEHTGLTLDEDDVVTEYFSTLSIPGDPTTTSLEFPIAADYNKDGERVELIYVMTAPAGDDLSDNTANFSLRIGNTEVALTYADYSVVPYIQYGTELSGLDLRTGVVVVNESTLRSSEAVDQIDFSTAVFRDGVLLGREQHATLLDPNSNYRGFFGEIGPYNLGQSTTSPMFAVAGVSVTGAVSPIYYERWWMPGSRSFQHVPKDEMFGVYREDATAYNMAETIGTTVFPTYATDSRGKRTPASVAADDKKVLVSTTARYPSEEVGPIQMFVTTANFVAGTTLPVLTGIDGDLPRFSVVWQLGALPQLT